MQNRGIRLKLSKLCALLLCSILTCKTSQVLAESSVALVIGNNSYSASPLYNPINDAQAVGKLLRGVGYDTQVLLDADRYELEAALDEFSKKGKAAKNAIFYFAGHGIQVEGENYLIPIGAIPENKRDLRKLLSLSEIITEVGSAEKLGLIILDSCRDNPFAAEISDITVRGSVARGLTKTSRVDGNTLVAYATEADAVARDGVGRHSPFTEALLRHAATPRLDVRRLLGKVRDDVISSTNGAQKPYVYGSLGGDEYFINASLIPENAINGSLPAKFARSLTRFEQAIEAKNIDDVLSMATVSEYKTQYLKYVFDEFETVNISLGGFSYSEDKQSLEGVLTIDMLVRKNGDHATPAIALRSTKITAESTSSEQHHLFWR